jgi:CheY-like chemotaxis protein
MLAFARRQDLQLVRVEIPTLVRGMTNLIERALGPSIVIDTRFPLRLSAVLADVNQLEMALLNLVVNGRDAMPDGGSITIAAQQHVIAPGDPNGMLPGTYVAATVIDTGAGMDAEVLSRAREPFFTTKGVGKGTGLGLSMVHGLAEQSGGRLVLESEPGKGTCAALWLPAAAQAADDPAEIAERPELDVNAQTPSLTVLVVDDDSLVLMNTAALLEDLGHTVFEALSGEDALAIFRSEPGINLVITDQAMPRMTGLQLAQAIFAERAEVPIILATGYGELPGDADPALRKLNKPFGQAELARAVAAACSEPRTSRTGPFSSS